MSRSTLNPLFRRIARAPLLLYRWHLGWILGSRFLLLVHTGRRTAIPRQTVLEVMRFNRRTGEVVMMSGLGRRSDWYRNLQGHTRRR
ncbi:MAG: nitroreductase/quinone reductase family protein [Acidimicrobiales bacterium]